MKKIKIGLLGASGKMGQALRQSFGKNFIPQLAVSSQNCPEFKIQKKSISDLTSQDFKAVDVWIDFTRPEYLKDFLKVSKGAKIKLVSGTTGLNKKEFSQLKSFSKKSAVFWASNMSPGLWALRQALKALKLIPQFQVSIEETHHIHKKDNPSGTAITLQKDIESILKRKIPTPIGHRIDQVFGIHKISVKSESETVQFEHIAHNRTVFAQGALKAAAFLVKKKQGFYSMDDLNK